MLRDDAGVVMAVEVKSGATVTADALRGLKRWKAIAGDAAGHAMLVYAGRQSYRRDEIDIVPWAALKP